MAIFRSVFEFCVNMEYHLYLTVLYSRITNFIGVSIWTYFYQGLITGCRLLLSIVYHHCSIQYSRCCTKLLQRVLRLRSWQGNRWIKRYNSSLPHNSILLRPNFLNYLHNSILQSRLWLKFRTTNTSRYDVDKEIQIPSWNNIFHGILSYN